MRNDVVRNLDVHRLRTFVTVAETANMTRAAEILFQTQGSVSQQIRKLEDELGHTLFRRDRPSLSLTEHGERLLVKARKLLTLNDAIWCEMTTPRCGGTVSLGIPLDLAGGCSVADALRSFSHRYPDVDIKLRCEGTSLLKEAVSTGELDLAILEEHSSDQLGETLRTERLVWIGATGGEAHGRSPLPLSLTSGACIFRPHVFEALEKEGRTWKSVFESEHFEASIAMIRTDMAIGATIGSRSFDGIEILGEGVGLPILPQFNITLMTRKVRSEQCYALAKHLTQKLGRSHL